MTGALGLNRQNDTPIGGLPEFRGNLQGGDVFGIDTVPAWDGEKFAPAANSALLLAYGGLVTAISAGHTADGGLVDDWDATTPLFGVPLQTIPSVPAGTITILQAGTYEISFNIGLANLSNNISYLFALVVNGVSTNFGSAVAGSNNLSEQTTGFTIQATIGAGIVIGVSATAPASQTFDVVNATLTVKRIG